MPIVLLAFIILFAGGASAMGKRIASCQAYLLAPVELKEATKDLISQSTPSTRRLTRANQIAEYVNQVPGSDAVADYLKTLREDAVDSSRALSENLLAEYIMRPGNTSMTIRRLPVLLEVFWSSLRFDRNGLVQVTPWMEKILRFLSSLTESHGEATHQAWNSAYEKYAPQFVDFYGFNKIFQRTVAYLKAGHRIAMIRENEERLHYVLDLIQELKYPMGSTELELSTRFYFLDQNPFQNNETYLLDMRLCAGRDPRAASPLHAFVFFYRLADRLYPDFTEPHFLEIRRQIETIEQLQNKPQL